MNAVLLSTIAKNNGFPSHFIHNLRNKLITKTQHTFTTQTQQKKGSHPYHSPLVHKVTNLFKHTNLNLAFRTAYTIYKQVSDKIIQN
jgi:hypothetical protein